MKYPLVGVRLSHEEYSRLKALAESLGITIPELIRRSIKRRLRILESRVRRANIGYREAAGKFEGLKRAWERERADKDALIRKLQRRNLQLIRALKDSGIEPPPEDES